MKILLKKENYIYITVHNFLFIKIRHIYIQYKYKYYRNMWSLNTNHHEKYKVNYSQIRRYK